MLNFDENEYVRAVGPVHQRQNCERKNQVDQIVDFDHLSKVLGVTKRYLHSGGVDY